MTENTPEAPPTGDPRAAYAEVTSKVIELMNQVTEADLVKPTPCTEFNVKQLLEHLVQVQRQLASVGNGAPFSEDIGEEQDSGWADSFTSASHDVMTAWTDDAKLGQMFSVPWGDMPGGALVGSWTGELVVHAWDLATALGVQLAIDDAVLEPVLEGAKFIPAEGRDDPDMPFGPVVEVGADAPVLLRLAGWMGRQVQS